MKIGGATRRAGLILASFALILCVIRSSAQPDNDALAQQKAAIQAMDDARQEYLKTGDVLRFKSKLDEPARQLSDGLGEFNRTHNSAAAALSLLKLGEIDRLQEKYPTAVVHFLAAIAQAQVAGDQKTHAMALIGQGRCELVGSKDYKSASEHFQKAAELAAKLPDRAPLFNAIGWQAAVEVATGNPLAAADLLGRAFALAPQLQDQSLLLFAHIDRADVFEKLAEKSVATKAYKAQLEGLKAANAEYETAATIAKQLAYSGILGQIEQFQRHLAFRRQMTEMNLRFDAVLAQNTIFAPKKPSDVLANEEFVAGQVDLPAEFIALVQREHVLEVGDARSFVTRGQFHAMAGETEPALADYLKAADALEGDRRNLRDEQSRETFFNDRIVFYYPAICALLQAKRFAEAFAIMERSRSRAMADLIFGRKLALTQPNEQRLFAEAQRLRAEIAVQQKKLFDYRTRPEANGLSAEIKATEGQIAQLEKSEQSLAREIETKAPRLRELTISQPASLTRVQEMLRHDGSEMFYYLVLDQSLILWHIAPDTQHARSVFLPRSELKTKVAALRASVASKDAKFDEKTARELFLYLVQPALGGIKAQHLIIIPHAELHDLPFAALIAPNGKSLGEMFALSDAPNAGLLLDLKKGEAIGNGRLFAAADPEIEDARSEVAAVGALYPERNKVMTDSLIAEAEVKAVAGQYDVLHLSVHGKFTPLEPMLSYLQLGNNADDDGRLTAAEMFGLSLGKTHLVVLSACETGQAEATPGNEVLGMERALLYAGANNLVLSQWAVDAESTAHWMKTFHQEAQVKPLAEATRLALIETKKKYPGPYYWAAFRLVGR